MYGMVMFALLQSNIYWVFSLILSLILSVYFIHLWRIKTPGAACTKIQYIEQQWRVHAHESHPLPTCHGLSAASIETYHNIRIRFDIGGLMWLVFEKKMHAKKVTRKHILLFQDQMHIDEHRMFRVLLRVL
jgi:hypothetical protein